MTMSTPPSRKRPADDVGDRDERVRVARPATKRRRSQSNSSAEHPPQLDLDKPTKINRPAVGSGYDLARLNYHLRLQDFAVELQKAANAVFPGGQTSRYTKVDVILLSWEDENPELSISSEIRELADTFANLYGYHVEEWLIPAEEDSHNRLQVKILQFLWASNPDHLKIVYYAGHSKLGSRGQSVLTSRRNSQKERCSTVKWTAIQNSLEESRSDVLVLFDCCASGVCTTDEGNGVTEMIAAWACKNLTENLGPSSFTQALNTKLKLLSQLPYFTVGQLYNAIFTEIQSQSVEPSELRPNKLPVHLVLTRFHDSPRSICLSKFSKPSQQHDAQQTTETTNPVPQLQAAGTPVLDSPSPDLAKTPSSANLVSPNQSTTSSTTSLFDLPEYPRLLFSIRILEDFKASELSTEIFLDWLKKIPIKVNLVRVEAGFASDSTLLMFSILPAILGYLPENPAMTLLGTLKSKNIMATFPQPPTPPFSTLTSKQQQQLKTDETDTRGKTKSPPVRTNSPTKKEEPPPPQGGCRYIMFREDIRPMQCACQGYSEDTTTSTPNIKALCHCGHKPCYHLATRSQTVYREELEALTKKVYRIEQDVKRVRLRSGAGAGAGGAGMMMNRGFGFEGQGQREREAAMVMAPPGYRRQTNERPLVVQDRGGYLVPGQPGPELWNFRGA